MAIIKNPEDEFVNELEAYLDIRFDKYSLSKVTTLLGNYKKQVIENQPPIKTVIHTEKIVYRNLKRCTIIPEDVKFIDPTEVLTKVADGTGLSVKDIVGRKRNHEFIVARHVAMYMIRKLSGYPLSAVGKMFNRDHSTVIYAIDHVTNMTEVQSPQYLKLIGYVNFHLSIPEKQSA